MRFTSELCYQENVARPSNLALKPTRMRNTPLADSTWTALASAIAPSGVFRGRTTVAQNTKLRSTPFLLVGQFVFDLFTAPYIKAMLRLTLQKLIPLGTDNLQSVLAGNLASVLRHALPPCGVAGELNDGFG